VFPLSVGVRKSVCMTIFPIPNKYFCVVNAKLSYDDARDYCSNNGMTLFNPDVSSSSKAQMDIKLIMTELKTNIAFSRYWIGGKLFFFPFYNKI